MKKSFNLLPILLLLVFLSCKKEKTELKQDPVDTREFDLIKEPVLMDLATPWGMVFLNDSMMLVAEKSGNIVLGNVNTGAKRNIYKVVPSVQHGQGGLMDIRLHPDFNTNTWIYFSYTKQVSGRYTTAIGRAKYANETFSDFNEIFAATALSSSTVHFGSRLAFDAKGHLFLALGDRGNMLQAQNTKNHMGCVLRLTDDGRVPSDNPFVGDSDYLPEIWTYGNRNIQGLDFNPASGELWAHEHGPQGGDEINILKAGTNYGWPLATFGEQYGGGFIGDTAIEGTEQPVFYWVPSIAPCGMVFLKSDKYPQWKGSLFIGTLAGQHLNRTVFVANKKASESRYFIGEGRIRNVVESTDGYIYFADESKGIIYKLVPVFK